MPLWENLKMAGKFDKVLAKIEQDNNALKEAETRLKKAFVKLDTKLNAISAGVRIEPYETAKGKVEIGYRRFESGWHITTVILGTGGLRAELPAAEAPAAQQVEIMAHVADLLAKVSGELDTRCKLTSSALKEADALLSALS